MLCTALPAIFVEQTFIIPLVFWGGIFSYSLPGSLKLIWLHWRCQILLCIKSIVSRSYTIVLYMSVLYLPEGMYLQQFWLFPGVCVFSVCISFLSFWILLQFCMIKLGSSTHSCRHLSPDWIILLTELYYSLPTNIFLMCIY